MIAKIILFMKNRYLLNWIIRLTEHLPQDMLQSLVVFYLVWNLLENKGLFYIYGLSSTRVPCENSRVFGPSTSVLFPDSLVLSRKENYPVLFPLVLSSNVEQRVITYIYEIYLCKGESTLPTSACFYYIYTSMPKTSCRYRLLMCRAEWFARQCSAAPINPWREKTRCALARNPSECTSRARRESNHSIMNNFPAVMFYDRIKPRRLRQPTLHSNVCGKCPVTEKRVLLAWFVRCPRQADGGRPAVFSSRSVLCAW